MRSIPVIADVPTARPGLGFTEYVEAIAGAIRGGEPAQFTIGLYGAWGSGKSSLLAALHSALDADADEVIPVLFDAWRHERSEHVIVPLVHAIYAAVAASGSERVANQIGKALKAILFSLKFTVAGVQLSTADVRAGLDDDPLAPLDDAFARPFAELRDVPPALAGKRIVVLIDDLDRCSPENVVSVLEAINLVMDVPGFVFVLALDYDVLIHAIEQKYPHASGHRFIEKMVQLPFRVPPLAVDSRDFLEQLLPDWRDRDRQRRSELGRIVREIVTSGFGANPRQLKRLINSFLLVERIVGSRRLTISSDLLAAVIGLQLAWPAEHQAFQDAVLNDIKDAERLLHDSGDDALEKYARRFFSDAPAGNVELRRALQLTSVVVADQPPPLEAPAEELRMERREWLLGELARQGYKPSPRSPRLLYNKRTPQHRFVLTKQVIRFEKRKGDEWLLWESYLLTREADLALEILKNPNRRLKGTPT